MVQLSFADAEAPGMDDDNASLSAVAREFTAQDIVHDPTSIDAAVAISDNSDTGALFINSLRLLLQESLLHTPPRPRAARQEPASLVPHCSDRLTAKAPFHDPNLEKQAKCVLVNKWERRSNNTVIDTPDDKIADKFHKTFAEPLSPYKREAMRELIPLQGALRNVNIWVTP
jgi:hypothetical protein